jgi:hypothetical protein
MLPAMLLSPLGLSTVAAVQQVDPVPTVAAGVLPPDIQLDGELTEPAWTTVRGIENLTMIEPTEAAAPTGRTRVKVLASRTAVVIGVICEDPQPDRIVSYTKQRDGELSAEDHIRVVLDPFLDGRSGYVFQVNPSGARYDALIEPDGWPNSNWDGVWDAATHRNAQGWSVEIRIPIQTLSFKRDVTSWYFNVERRIQRLQETDRWASPRRDWAFTQTSRAGLLTDLPAFDLALGLTLRPAIVAGGGRPAPGARLAGTADPSLDVSQHLGPNLLGSLSVNTDFAETEVDTRRTNFTRFPVFFPEKRTFFLEGSDLFQFGTGLGDTLVPFFSRRVGLVSGHEVPIAAGGKIGGRLRATSLGALLVRTRAEDTVAPATTLGVVRIKQNVLKESSVGFIATGGDPAGGRGSWLAGTDATFQTSHFRGDKNFLVGVSGQAMGHAGARGDRTAAAVKIAYPNDLWNAGLTVKRIGESFQPSLGFVPRPGVYDYQLGIDYSPRPHNGWLRQMFYEFQTRAVTDLAGRWESYEVFTAPVNWRLESGDRFEFNAVPVGERLTAPDEVAGVPIPAGAYQWMRYRLEAGSAAKRPLSGQVTWRFGGFYDGSIDQVELTGTWHASPVFTFDLSAERDTGAVAAGSFAETLVGLRSRVSLSPDLQVSSFLQYDTTSGSIGTNTRMRWTFRPVGDVFVIYNHNLRTMDQRWRLDSNQLLVKLQYAFRY